jgi:hypothetical protein
LWVALSSLMGSTLFAALSALTRAPTNLWPLVGVASLLALVISSTFVAAGVFARLSPSLSDQSRFALGLLLLIAASFHLLLLGEHADESLLLGLGFLTSGLIQLGLATVVTLRPRPGAYYGVIALNVALIVLYAAHVVIGLPLTPTARGGFTLGPTEAVDAVSVATKASELMGVAFAFALLHLPGHDSILSPLRQTKQPAGG